MSLQETGRSCGQGGGSGVCLDARLVGGGAGSKGGALTFRTWITWPPLGALQRAHTPCVGGRAWARRHCGQPRGTRRIAAGHGPRGPGAKAARICRMEVGEAGLPELWFFASVTCWEAMGRQPMRFQALGPGHRSVSSPSIPLPRPNLPHPPAPCRPVTAAPKPPFPPRLLQRPDSGTPHAPGKAAAAA